MSKILLDSDVVINLLKKNEETIQKIKSFGESEFFVSPIVIAEIYAGIKPKEYKRVEELFDYFIVIDIDTDIGKYAGEYANLYKKAFCGISLEDYLIAATAKKYDLYLWTYNKKHYPMQDIRIV